MDLKTIKTFKTIVTLGSFQRAAEELNYAQSTITMHIKSLESELNVGLLERGKNLQLTEAGKILYEKADLLLKGFDNLTNAMNELAQGGLIPFRLGVMEPTASFRIPSIIAEFSKKFPKVQLSIQIQSNKILNEMVAKGEVDLAICTEPESSVGMIFQPLFQEEVVLLASENHPILQQSQILLKELEHETLVTTTSHCPFRNNFESQMIRAGVSPIYGLEVSNMLGLKYYVQACLGVAVVPKIAVTPTPEGTVTKPISDFEKGLTVGLLKKTDYDGSEYIIKELMSILYKTLYRTEDFCS